MTNTEIINETVHDQRGYTEPKALIRFGIRTEIYQSFNAYYVSWSNYVENEEELPMIIPCRKHPKSNRYETKPTEREGSN